MKDFNTREVRYNLTHVIKVIIEHERAKSKAEIARSLGMTPQGLSEILAGRNKITLEFIHNLCLVYGISYNYVVNGATPIFDDENINDVVFSRFKEESAMQKLKQYELSSKDIIIATKDEIIAMKDSIIESLRSNIISLEKNIKLLEDEVAMYKKENADLHRLARTSNAG